MAPVAGSATLELVAVKPAGRVPRVTVPSPLIFTSEGCTTNVKLLPGKTVVGDGVAQSASAAGLDAGYGKGSETSPPKLVTVRLSAPDLLKNPFGRKPAIVVGPVGTVCSDTPLAEIAESDSKFCPVTETCSGVQGPVDSVEVAMLTL